MRKQKDNKMTASKIFNQFVVIGLLIFVILLKSSIFCNSQKGMLKLKRWKSFYKQGLRFLCI